MTPPLTLPTTPPEHGAMDFALLRAEGIRHLESMAGQLWTDYNVHDPGITILEQLCYAITDLGYRIGYELPDLLAGSDGDPYRSLYTAADILTSEPVTLTDLRKLVLDVPGVKNAWIERAESQIPLRYHEGKRELQFQGDPLATDPMTTPVDLAGLYRVLIETSDLAGIDGTVVQREVTQRLYAHRNLCEDFEEIQVLDAQDIQVHARVEIGPVDDAEQVLLGIYEKIAHYISPGVPFATMGEMMEAGKTADEIFDGPPLTHGFVDSQALRNATRRTAIHTSDLINEIMAVPGVRAIRDISVAAGERREAWALDLDLSRTPRLDLQGGSTIILEKEQLTVSVDVEKVLATYLERRRSSTRFRPLPRAERDIVPPTGRDRRPGDYDSIHHQFPAVYGIGDIGLPESAPPERKAKAKQLKAYLMFFDQLLANYFAQLAHAKDLFSFFGDGNQTYFSQMIDDATLALDDIRKSEAAQHRSVLEGMSQTPEGPAAASDRKNRFLNHLMARFAEQFTDYSLILFDLIEKGGISPDEKLIHDKQAFLREYPRISGARGTAFNYLSPWNRTNRSGLEDRIRLKLGLDPQDGEGFYVVEHILLRPMEGDEYQELPLLAAARSKDPYSLQLSFVFPSWPSRFGKPEFKQFIEQTVREETPAHLTPYVHWLEEVAMNKFESAYRDWLERRRHYWMDRLGL